MDLAASATFVAEPEEAGIMNKPPRNPNEKFIDRSLLTSLGFGSLSLFAAVTTTYLLAWYLNPSLSLADIQHAQTVAFATWMLGHIFLALNFRSEKEPLLKLGVLSNKVMVLWSLAVIVTLIVGTSVPGIASALRLTSLSLIDWIIVVATAFVATFWMEIIKILQNRAIK